MIKSAFLVFSLLLLSLLSVAQTANFDNNGNQLVRFDNLGDAIDAHDGEIAYFDGIYYLYGTSYDCGYEWGNKDAPFCGFKVYTSTDMKNWADKGFLFDATTPIWQSRCNGKTYGCYRPHVIYNIQTGTYVLWINVYDNSVGFRVFTSKTALGPFNEVNVPKLAVNSQMPVAGLNNGDHDTFVDDDGTAYLAYTNWRAKGAIVIEKLSDDYLTGTGEHLQSVTDSNTEAPCLFKRNGIYYIIYSDPNCGYCSGTGSSYRTALSPLGPWSGSIKISENSCGGQPSFVSAIKVNSDTVFLYGVDLWNNAAKNEALANYYWAPLIFNELGGIKPLNCQQNIPFIKAKKPVHPTGPDINTSMEGFGIKSDLTKGRQYAQSFKVGRSGKLNKITVTLFKNHYPDAGLVIELYKAGSDGLPNDKAIFSKNIPSAAIGWSAKNIAVQPNLYVKKGEVYAIVLSTDASTGNYGFAYSDAAVYTQGKMSVCVKGQGAFDSLPFGSIKFQTFVSP